MVPLPLLHSDPFVQIIRGSSEQSLTDPAPSPILTPTTWRGACTYSWQADYFPGAAIINYHEFDGLNQEGFLLP